MGLLLRNYFGLTDAPAPENVAPRTLTTAELQRVLEAEKGFAESTRQRNPFL